MPAHHLSACPPCLASCHHVVPLRVLAPPAHPTHALATYPLPPQMHLNGLEDSEKDGFLKKFFGVVCPVAATLQTKGRRLAVHWADSGEIRRETPKDQKRMAMPADACKDAANIDYWVGGRDGGHEWVDKGALCPACIDRSSPLLATSSIGHSDLAVKAMQPGLRGKQRKPRILHPLALLLIITLLPTTVVPQVRPGWLGYGTDLDTNAALAVRG